jgi:lipoate-protein ligase A
MTTVRLLPHQRGDGPHNMAADEVLLELAEKGTGTLRFYTWAEPTVSLGYFQSHRLLQEDRLLAVLPFVRRPTGGATLVHHHELTYALALPATNGAKPQATQRMHGIVAAALGTLGIQTNAAPEAASQAVGCQLCFRQMSAGDLLIGANKVVGSAQRKRRGALLQHGAILLAQSPHAPALAGILELTGKLLPIEQLMAAIRREWTRVTGRLPVDSSWTEAELKRIEELAGTRYSADSWNRKR